MGDLAVILDSTISFEKHNSKESEKFHPEGRPAMSDVSLRSGISGLSFDSPFLSPLLFVFLSFFLPSPLALSVLSFFC